MGAKKAKILIGPKWYPCVVDRIDDIPHWSGQVIRRFTCRMKNGDTICCGRNSIRLAPTPNPPPLAARAAEKVDRLSPN